RCFRSCHASYWWEGARRIRAPGSTPAESVIHWRRRGRRSLLGLLRHHGLGGDQEAGDGSRVLQRRADHLGRIDDAFRKEIAVAARLGIVTPGVFRVLDDL